jgi:PAS domain S-box-containing protein
MSALHRLKTGFLNLSLAYKLTVIAVATSAVSVAGMCAVLGWYQSSSLRTRLVSDSEILADMVAASSTAALAFRDAAGASETLRTVSVNRQIAMAAILLPDGSTLARYDRSLPAAAAAAPWLLASPQVPRAERWHGFRDGTLALSRQVVLENERLGTVYVEVSLSELNAALMTLWRALALALFGTVAVAGGIAWRLQRLVSAPLLHLAAVTRAVTHDRNYGIRAALWTDDEVGEVVSAFNEMLDHIQQRDATLESHRLQLERTVDERTAELKANVERYKLLVESTHAVPWEVDGRTHVFSYISPQVSKVLGHDSQSLVDATSMLDLVHPDDRQRVLEQLTALTRTGGDVDIDYRVVTPQKRVIDVRSVVTAHESGQGGTVVLRGITVDVTRQKKLELELRQAQKLESVGRLAAGVAHEINTPVQFVSDSVHFVRDAMNDLITLIHAYQGMRDMAQGCGATCDAFATVVKAEEDADIEYVMENVPKALDRSLDGLNRVATIVRSMKEFAHPDQKEMASVNLNQAIQSTLTIARNEYKYVADVRTEFGDLPLVTCHVGDVNQVILNIVVNAAHAIEDVVRGTEHKGEITVRTETDGDSVLVSITDTGHGIPESVRDRIFDPFFTTKEVGKGTGQGLAIARTVVHEKHGGELSFETETGKGTTFRIRLPLVGRREGKAA